MASLRLVHLSDPHLAFARPPAGNPEQVLGWLNWLVNRRFRHRAARFRLAAEHAVSLAPDLVLLTGDLTQTGRVEEVALARSYLAPLLEARIPVLLLAGNHDSYDSGPAVSAAWERLRTALAPELDGRGVIVLGDAALLLLEQARPTPLGRSWGETGAEQLAVLDEHLEGATGVRLRLAAGHYPLLGPGGAPLPRARCLRDAETVRNFLAARGIAAYFCGHLHREFALELHPGCMQYCAGSVTAADPARVRLYEL